MTMFFDPRCVPCIINQAYNAARLFNKENKELQLKIVKEACKAVDTIDHNYTAPMFSLTIQSIIEKHLGIVNPYKQVKERNKKTAEKYIPFFRMMMEGSRERLDTALRIAIIGNVIDLGANPKFDLEYEINRITSNRIDISSLPRFKEDLKKAERILYVGDNYEEALFDKFLLAEFLPKQVFFAVRSKPILNDITLEDAHTLGINDICNVIESGSQIAGTDLRQCTPEFLDLYEKADVVIAKGQGNLETLINETRPIYFLFKVKCEVIAERFGYPLGYGVLMSNQAASNCHRMNEW
jgi:uncharacterized protein with ATP-grasp and redox domains